MSDDTEGRGAVAPLLFLSSFLTLSNLHLILTLFLSPSLTSFLRCCLPLWHMQLATFTFPL